MIKPKFKVGDTVWMQSNWFAGSYIPDCFVVFEIRGINGKIEYRKKRAKTWWPEEKLFATEEECQLSEIKRFVRNARQQASELVNNCRLLGVEDKAIKLLTTDAKALPAPNITAKKKIFNVGDKVWGHLEKSIETFGYANPKEYTITERIKCSDEEKEWYVYHVKGHGTLDVDEDNLFPTREEALLAHAKTLRKDSEDVLRGLKERCKTLNLPTDNLLLLENNSND